MLQERGCSSECMPDSQTQLPESLCAFVHKIACYKLLCFCVRSNKPTESKKLHHRRYGLVAAVVGFEGVKLPLEHLRVMEASKWMLR